MLPDTDEPGAVAVGERLRRQLGCRSLVRAASEFGKVTVSVGVGTLDEPHDPSAIIDLADAALYTSKSAGRNRTTAAQGLAFARVHHRVPTLKELVSFVVGFSLAEQFRATRQEKGQGRVLSKYLRQSPRREVNHQPAATHDVLAGKHLSGHPSSGSKAGLQPLRHRAAQSVFVDA
ncbi:diguanylate cyclase domain-containing protein [Rhizobium mesoamericanum]|uniref:diguanylate cyclase domain-containing protein n=1 Tax=Rhizobium mesoamericanum TaxID=1079800 RepID=UPI00399D58A3